MTHQAPQTPGPGGMVNDPKDPTQRLPSETAGENISPEDKAIMDQQHTGNHQKPGREQGGADIRCGTRAGAENVEPKDGQQKDKATG